MLDSRWRKALRDLWLNRARTVLVVLAITVGIAGFGAVLTTYAILNRELSASYMAANPASATLWVERLDADFLAALRARPQITAAEARQTVTGRIQTGPDEWRTLWLFVLADYEQIDVSIISPQSGVWPPAGGEILIERKALALSKAAIGEEVVIKLPDSPPQPLRLVGTTHDPVQAPAWMEGIVYGYVTRDTLAQLGIASEPNELKIVVAGEAPDEAQVRATADELAAWIEQSGRTVSRVEVPPPGKHVHWRQLEATLFLQARFGLLALVLGGVLAATLIAAMMAQQVRQIGVMKAVGGRPGQIMGLYFGAVIFLGLVAVALALPLGIWLGRVYATFMMDMFNFNLTSMRVPLWVWAAMAAVGILTPAIIAAYPIWRGSRITVREAISDYGIAQGARRPGAIERRPFPFLNRPFLLSLRNTFRRRGRLVLTLGTLAAGGAIFIAALIIRASLLYTVDRAFTSQSYDVTLRFSRPYPVEAIREAVEAVPGVVQVETWGMGYVTRLYDDGRAGNRLTLVAPPAATRLLDGYPLRAGRRFQPGDEDVLLINQMFAQEEGVGVGDTITLTLAGQATPWSIIGVLEQMTSGSMLSVPYERFVGLTGQGNVAELVCVVSESRDAAALDAVKQGLERQMLTSGLDVLANNSIADWRQVLIDHMVVITVFLMVTAALIVVVGGLGLASTMSINVLERRRELGVLRAIGASNGAIQRLIVIEGTLIGVLSWLIAAAAAAPLGVWLGSMIADMLFEMRLEFVFPPVTFLVWLGLAAVLAAAASFYPAWSASQLTVREVLAYE